MIAYLLVSILSILRLVHSSPYADIDETWKEFLENSPPEAVALASNLTARADAIALAFDLDLLTVDLNDIDVVCSGGGNFDAFYMGVSMILDRILRRVGAVPVNRYGGASAGGMMPFEIALKGELTTLRSHLSYGVLTKKYASVYAEIGNDLYLENHHWNIMARWQMLTYQDQLETLNNRIFLTTSCFKPLLTQTIISSYTAEHDQAKHAFMSTGTYLELYDGHLCSDGGMTSGPNMTPLFQDNLRDQLVVNLMLTGFPSSCVYRVDLEIYKALIEVGMDEMVNFLKTGKTSDKRAGSISLCPAGSDVKTNVCASSI